MNNETDFDAEDDGIYGAGDVYGATADFWGGSEEENPGHPSQHSEAELSSEETLEAT